MDKPKNTCFHFLLSLSYLFLIGFCVSCSSQQEVNEVDLEKASWSEVELQSEGSTVSMMMWTGDPLINQYMNGYIKPQVKERFKIDLEISTGQGGDIVTYVVAQGQTGKRGVIDMVWINGETFYQLRQLNALYGPFTDYLPSNQYVNWDNPFIANDFQQPVDGFEAPWGNVQMTLIYDEARVKMPPLNRSELADWVKANPGRFTIPTEFAGLTFLKSLLIDFAGGGGALSGEFDADVYEKHAKELWAYLNDIKLYFWKEGETFPETVAQMHQMFANGELWFTLSNNDAEVDNKIAEGLFQPTAKAYVMDFGSIQNSHYLGVLNSGRNHAGALTVINFMQSPEAQFQKAQPEVWGDGTILQVDKLPLSWKHKFQNIPGRQRAPDRAELQENALMELAPQYMIRLNEDFRKFVIEK